MGTIRLSLSIILTILFESAFVLALGWAGSVSDSNSLIAAALIIHMIIYIIVVFNPASIGFLASLGALIGFFPQTRAKAGDGAQASVKYGVGILMGVATAVTLILMSCFFLNYKKHPELLVAIITIIAMWGMAAPAIMLVSNAAIKRIIFFFLYLVTFLAFNNWFIGAKVPEDQEGVIETGGNYLSHLWNETLGFRNQTLPSFIGNWEILLFIVFLIILSLMISAFKKPLQLLWIIPLSFFLAVGLGSHAQSLLGNIKIPFFGNQDSEPGIVLVNNEFYKPEFGGNCLDKKLEVGNKYRIQAAGIFSIRSSNEQNGTHARVNASGQMVDRNNAHHYGDVNDGMLPNGQEKPYGIATFRVGKKGDRLIFSNNFIYQPEYYEEKVCIDSNIVQIRSRYKESEGGYRITIKQILLQG